MQRIVIDARVSGTSTGRYIDKLVENLAKLRPDYEFIVLAKKPRVEFMKKIAPDFKIVESNFKEFTFAEQFRLLRQLKELEADLIHFGMTQQPVLYRDKVVTTIHDLTTARFTNTAKGLVVFKLKQQVYKWMIKRVARKSEELIVPSQFVKQDVAQFARIDADKISVIYEAADKISASVEPIASLVGQEFIMYVGRAQPHKNLYRLVDAFDKLIKTHHKMKLVLVGKIDANHKELQKYVKDRGVNDVIFTDFVSEGGLHWLYENTKAYVFPSLSEGFGLPALEAMVHGAPIVSSKATCLPEIYGDAAHYFDPNDTVDMAAKIKDVLSDSSLRYKLVENGKLQTKKYSWENTARRTLDVYKKGLGLV